MVFPMRCLTVPRVIATLNFGAAHNAVQPPNGLTTLENLLNRIQQDVGDVAAGGRNGNDAHCQSVVLHGVLLVEPRGFEPLTS